MSHPGHQNTIDLKKNKFKKSNDLIKLSIYHFYNNLDD